MPIEHLWDTIKSRQKTVQLSRSWLRLLFRCGTMMKSQKLPEICQLHAQTGQRSYLKQMRPHILLNDIVLCVSIINRSDKNFSHFLNWANYFAYSCMSFCAESDLTIVHSDEQQTLESSSYVTLAFNVYWRCKLIGETRLLCSTTWLSRETTTWPGRKIVTKRRHALADDTFDIILVCTQSFVNSHCICRTRSTAAVHTQLRRRQ